MENLEKLKSWVDEKNATIKNDFGSYPNIDSRKPISPYSNFTNRINDLNMDMEAISILKKIRNDIDTVNSSEELLRDLIRQREICYGAANTFLTSSNLDDDSTDEDIANFGNALREFGFHYTRFKIFDNAIHILEGEIDT